MNACWTGCRVPVRCRDAFHGCDLAAARLVGQRRAGIDRRVVGEHGAGAAFGPVAADLGAGESQPVADRLGQGLAGRHVDAARLAVDVERDQPFDAAHRRARLARLHGEHVRRRRNGDTRTDDAAQESPAAGAGGAPIGFRWFGKIARDFGRRRNPFEIVCRVRRKLEGFEPQRLVLTVRGHDISLIEITLPCQRPAGCRGRVPPLSRPHQAGSRSFATACGYY